jgi:hypothetical protein
VFIPAKGNGMKGSM